MQFAVTLCMRRAFYPASWGNQPDLTLRGELFALCFVRYDTVVRTGLPPREVLKVKKRSFWAIYIIYTNDDFTKTGSGQTYLVGKVEKSDRCFCCRSCNLSWWRAFEPLLCSTVQTFLINGFRWAGTCEWLKWLRCQRAIVLQKRWLGLVRALKLPMYYWLMRFQNVWMDDWSIFWCMHIAIIYI